MNNSRITVDRMPLEEFLADEHSIEIALHVKTEAQTLAMQCGVRQRRSTQLMRLCRPGRPRRGASLTLAAKIEPYLRDDEFSVREIAELFGLSANDVKFYQFRLQIQRKKGRKSHRNNVRDAEPSEPLEAAA
jgi:hypothetical protein